MTSRRLGRDDFNRPTLQVARDLVGTYIVRSFDGRRVAAMITETEAYRGPRDAASHTFGGRRTARVEPLYGNGGTIYVYLVYGMHWLLNFSTVAEGHPEGVLIRGIVIENPIQHDVIVGPGRVTKSLGIDQRFSGTDATTSRELWLEDRGVRMPSRHIMRGPRVGIDYAGPYWAARPWRFWVDAKVHRRKAK